MTTITKEEVKAFIEQIESDLANGWEAQIFELKLARTALASLEAEPIGAFHAAYLEWSNKTEWVQTDKRFDVIKPWGKHRADVLREYIEHLEARQIALPQRLSPEGYHIDEAYMVDDAEGEYLDRDAVIEAISAAGIQVKGE
ncbi:hypothetical protein FKX64_00840 [Salmonella enterica subsp. enterica serovar Bahati]|nr:hypothetical protein [Salmonella enterica subsp. enterica serovar Kibi]ECG7292765.1 hypothetical protein [Salmonella enterica subsp. enterica serovar Bahati]ECJ1874784.1 hypothetical protein [Salmonella enterica subsp. enterica serovar Bahati]